jgi:hypothetical protein
MLGTSIAPLMHAPLIYIVKSVHTHVPVGPGLRVVPAGHGSLITEIHEGDVGSCVVCVMYVYATCVPDCSGI